MAEKVLKKEIEAWIEDTPEEYADAMIELQDVDSKDKILKFTIGEDELTFTISYPDTYPKAGEDKFFVFSDSSQLQDWQEKLNSWVSEKTKISELLNEAAEKFLKNGGSGGKMEEDEVPFEEDAPKQSKPKKSKSEVEIDDKLDKGEFLEIGSPQATLRLIRDLKSIKASKPEQLGFDANPFKSKQGENLYHWHIKLFSMDEKSDLAKDMKEYKKKTGNDHILIEMKFSAEYPHVPPFVRVVKPRFQFRTGHVTIGGSICMELLTKSGWSSTNDIESILIQIGAELVGGGARLDPGMANNYEYSESEAWDAFYRAAGQHGWNVKGLSSTMFPTIPKST